MINNEMHQGELTTTNYKKVSAAYVKRLGQCILNAEMTLAKKTFILKIQ